MAEEAVAAPEVKATQAEAQAPSDGLTPEGRAIADTIALAKSDPNFAKLPEVKAILDAAAKLPAKELTAKPAVAEKNETVEGDDDKDDKEAKPKKSVFTSNKGKAIPEFKTLEEQNAFIKEKYGVDQAPKFFNSVEQWRSDSQALPQYKETAENLTKLLSEEIPDPIYEAIQAWGKGEDWQAKMKGSIQPFDYSKPFAKQSFEVVNHFFPEQFTEEDLTDTKNALAQQAISVASAKFDLEKGKIDSARSAAIERADKAAENLKASAATSIAELKKEFPDFDNAEIKSLNKILAGGDINSLFFKKDGTYRPDAAKRLALMLYGNADASDVTVKAKKENDNEALMNLIDRGSDRPNKTAGAQMDTPKIPELVNSLLKGVNKKPTY